MRAGPVVVVLAAFCACSREPRFSPIPEQAPAVVAEDPPELPCFVSLSEPRAASMVVADLTTGPGAGWAPWTRQKPAVRCTLPTTAAWRAGFDFIIADATFKDTGPITVLFSVNGRRLASVRYDHPGEQSFRAALPAELAVAGAQVTLEAAIDKPWIAPSDGAVLGVLVKAAGFLAP